MGLTDALLAGCVLLLGFTLFRLWILNGDVRGIKVALTGMSGASGIVNDLESVKRTQGKHGIAIARLGGRVNQLDGRDDSVEL